MAEIQDNQQEKLTLRHFLTAAAVLLGIMMSVLDGTIMNVGLPTMSTEFGVKPSIATLVVNSYQLAITMLLLTTASLGEKFGFKRLYLTGLSLFTIASLLCALSQTFWMLVASRVIQGVGSACMMGVSTALLRFIYPQKVLGRALGMNAMVVAVSTAAGPSIAGGILSITTWHWLFLINIPIGITAFFLGRKRLPKTPRNKESFDKTSAIECALVFGLMINAVQSFTNSAPWYIVAGQCVLLIVIAILMLRRQRGRKAPLFPVDLLKIPMFSLSIFTSICSFTGQMLAMVSLPFLLERYMGFSPAEVGLLITPWPLATMVIAPFAGRIVEKIPAGIMCAVGMVLAATGYTMLCIIPEQASFWNIAWRMAICGAGFGLFQTPNNLTMISAAPKIRSGAASGMQSCARLLGQTCGTTIVAMIFRIIADQGTSAKACLITAAASAILAGTISLTRLNKKVQSKSVTAEVKKLAEEEYEKG